MIHVDVSGPIQTGGEAEMALLRDTFRERGHVHLPGFVTPTFLRQIQADLRTAPFVPKTHKGIGDELVCWDSVSGDKLTFFMNDPKVFAWIDQITGCGPLGSFLGRIYRMAAGASHHDSWHSDIGDHRLVALSANLSEEPYHGGTLIVREGGRPETEVHLPNTVPGDAIMFRLVEGFEHWISDVEEGPPKTAWAGWFRSAPTFLEMLAKKKSEPRG